MTLILYNDAPAAFPARVPSYDYYTGAPNLSPVGAPTILPGYGPNTRTIMQVKIAPGTPAVSFNLTKLQAAFRHNASGTGVFESGQHPIIVGQAAYNSAYGTAIASATDGTQIWRITHNGVDTHPIHFHLYDVQLVNRVTWDNIIIPADATELGWKDTVRIAPLEDTIVALRPIIPSLPFEIPNSIRNLSPMLPTGSTAMFNNVDPQGNPTANIVNDLVNFGWEYVYHCHILSHEEMDMMRPVSVALPPIAPNGLAFTITGNGNNRRVVLSWNDNSITETSFVVQRTTDGITWANVGTSPLPLGLPNIHETRTFTDPTSNATTP